MKASIRPFRKTDIIDLRQVFLLVRQETFTWKESRSFAEKDFDKETAEELIFVATDGNSIVGFISVWEPESFIHHLYILPEYQNRGIGKRLLISAMTKLTKPFKLKCQKKNHRALSFYTQLGWFKIGDGSDNTGEYLLLEYEGKI